MSLSPARTDEWASPIGWVACSRGAEAFNADRYDDAGRELEAAAEAGTERLEALTGLETCRLVSAGRSILAIP